MRKIEDIKADIEAVETDIKELRRMHASTETAESDLEELQAEMKQALKERF